MSKSNTCSDTEKQKLITQKDEAIKGLDKLMTGFINSDDRILQKKASLLSYWLKDYVNYLKWERGFDPGRLKRYKRGDILQVNLGYNVGSEEGGLHYAIVVDNKNAKKSPVITVIPLTSLKPNSTIHSNDLLLGEELYEKLKIKHDTLFQSTSTQRDNLLNELDEVMTELDSLSQLAKQSKLRPESMNIVDGIMTKNEVRIKQLECAVSDLTNDLNLLKKVENEIKRMKRGSIALIGQISTISKLRIYDPKNTHSVLTGIKLSPKKLDELNLKIKKLYIYE